MPDIKMHYAAWRAGLTWRNVLTVTGLTGILVIAIGLVLLGLGVELVVLGGTWYYALAGIGLIVSGLGFVAQRREALWFYGLVLAGTVLWAIAEVGFDGWKLMPRLFAPAVLGIWLCMPWVANALRRDVSGSDGEGSETARRNSWIGMLICVVIAAGVIGLGYATSADRYKVYGTVSASGPALAEATPVASGDWLFYGRTPAGDRFSPLSQITPENVKTLKVAWTVHTGDVPTKADEAKGREFNFEDTPTKVGNSLYVCTGHHRVLSLNATTGAKNWEFDPHGNLKSDIFLSCRGVAYYHGSGSGLCQDRIITTTGDARMVALDAATGQPCPGFGKAGYVSLTDHMGAVPPGFHFITSQPLVINGRIILGGWIYDDQTTGEPSGVVRAYDPDSGQLVWAWDVGRPDPTAPLKPGETYTRGTPNAWGTYTADAALGLVYLPMGNATPDYFNGERRPFDNAYSSAVVALDIKTGKERWHFQTVHRDVWDFDLPIGPSLVDVTTPQGVVPALVQTTKRGEFFLLDRRNGKSLTAVTEKPVPQNAAPGNIMSPTQPYPDMPSLAPKTLTAADTWGATPIDQLLCRIEFHQARYDGQFTPPTYGKYIAYPAFDGVTDWYGASLDTSRNLLVTNTNYVPFMMQVMPQGKAIKKGVAAPWAGWASGQPYPKLINVADNPQYGTPYAIVIKAWLNALDVPCFAPPWGSLTAIDLNQRKIVWQRPLGTTGGMGLFHTHLMVPLPTGIFSMGGSITTASGLVFIAGTTDDKIRAFDERNGKLLWEASLPAGGNATPMTYLGADGKQYVAIAAGGHGALKSKSGDAIVVYRLGS